MALCIARLTTLVFSLSLKYHLYADRRRCISRVQRYARALCVMDLCPSVRLSVRSFGIVIKIVACTTTQPVSHVIKGGIVLCSQRFFLVKLEQSHS